MLNEFFGFATHRVAVGCRMRANMYSYTLRRKYETTRMNVLYL